MRSGVTGALAGAFMTASWRGFIGDRRAGVSIQRRRAAPPAYGCLRLIFRKLGFDGSDELRRVRRSVRREAAHHFSVAAHQELLEVPENLRLRQRFDAVAFELFAERHIGVAGGLGLRGD